MEFITGIVDLESPITWGIVAALGLIIFIRRKNMFGAGDDSDKPRDQDQTRVFVHDDQGYDEKFGDTFSGNVAYGTGAFVKDETCAMRLYYGRPKRKPDLLSSRKATTIYTTRFGDASPLNPVKDDWEPDRVDSDQFNDYRAIAVEREYSRGRLDAESKDGQEKLFIAATAAVIGLAVITWAIVLILPLTPIVETSPSG